MDLRDYVCMYEAWDEMILPTRCSVFGGGIRSFLSSTVARIQELLQLVEKKSREARMQKQQQLVEKKLREAVRIYKLVEMEKSVWWKLLTTQKSDDGGWMKDYLRSRKARIQEQLQLVEEELNEARMQLAEMKKSDWWKLLTTQESDDGGWMKVLQRSKVARMQLAEMNDWINLSTTQKSDDGGWMKDYLSPELQRPDRSQVKAPRERNRSSLVRIKHQSMEGIVTFQGEPSSPWDVMNLPTALQAVVGGGM